jgi:hypothetical protein
MLGMIVATLLLFTGMLAQQSVNSPYADDAVWNGIGSVPQQCGAASWFTLFPDENVAHSGCIVSAMRALGASESAVRFFEATGQFLLSFDERGPIDFGHAASPLVNMGRGEDVLLNAAPSAILMSQAVNTTDDTWKGDPSYAGIQTSAPNAFPWVEYGGPEAERVLPDGSVEITASFDMRECRACASVGSMRLLFRFDPRGVLAATELLPPGPPLS